MKLGLAGTLALPTRGQALKLLSSSSSLSAIACTSAWVGGLETVPTRCNLNSQSSTSLVNWPRNSPETNGALSVGDVGSSMGVDVSKLRLVFRRPCSTPARPPTQAPKWIGLHNVKNRHAASAGGGT